MTRTPSRWPLPWAALEGFMFFIYLRRELRRRMRQVIFISLGLAIGIGLVITVTAASAGVAQAHGAVLHSLYGMRDGRLEIRQDTTHGAG
jgi:hypothetical protein